ncbi:MAG: 4-(cytidine 5'-diphospho)-2-C-methyl-D-erythritol kinase [Chlorobi bacterium]|nr:4-(cytidine 5'-diphospho)-2-C-methyl-D-erythritol kinase [Chlorobiota bacterium]
MLVFANAKINIGLHILYKRKDGFHNLESVFYPVPLYDIIEINVLKQKNTNYQFINSGLSVNSEIKDNLCIKAYLLLKEEFNLPPVKIHLHKIIPFGAGLGGGSSDAAFTIRALNNLFSLNLSLTDKIHFANLLGSDCAFFIKNEPSFVSGKGDVISKYDINLSGYFLVLVYAPIIVNTAEAYNNLELVKHNTPLLNFIKKGIGNWKHELNNDFEKSVFKKHTELLTIKNKLYKHGAVYASMSGSGSAVYGIFKEKTDLDNQFPLNYFTWQKKLD